MSITLQKFYIFFIAILHYFVIIIINTIAIFMKRTYRFILLLSLFSMLFYASVLALAPTSLRDVLPHFIFQPYPTSGYKEEHTIFAQETRREYVPIGTLTTAAVSERIIVYFGECKEKGQQ